MSRRRVTRPRPVVRRRDTPPSTARADHGAAKCGACGDTGWIRNLDEIRWSDQTGAYRHKTWNSCHHCDHGAHS